MLYPLFDKNSNLVAWVQDDRHIFDTSMKWIAFIEKGHVWSADNGEWLGVFMDKYCTDKQGRVFAWGDRTKIRGCIRPTTPTRPTRATRPCMPTRPTTPTRPTIPVRPVFGWSTYDLRGYLGQ